jgi:hypothetical protein
MFRLFFIVCIIPSFSNFFIIIFMYFFIFRVRKREREIRFKVRTMLGFNLVMTIRGLTKYLL